MEHVDLNSNRPISPNEQQPSVVAKPTEPGVFEINGKKYRIKEVKVGNDTINFQSLKHSDAAFKNLLQSIAEDVIQKSESQQVSADQKGLSGTSHKITLSSRGTAKLDGQTVGSDYQSTLEKVQKAASVIIKKQETVKTELQKHEFTKDPISPVKSVALRVGVVALSILTSPITISLGLAIYAGVGIHKLGKLIHNSFNNSHDLGKASDKMKLAEEKSKFEGLTKTYANFKTAKPDLKNTKALGDELNIGGLGFSQEKRKEILDNKVERHILNAFERNGKTLPNKETLNAIKNNLTLKDYKDFATLKLKLFEHYPALETEGLSQLDEILSNDTIQKIVNDSKTAFTDTSIQGQKALNELVNALKTTDPKDYAIANQNITVSLRDLINLPSYQAIKEDPNNSVVQLVSVLASAMWNEVQALPAYKELGETVLTKVAGETINAQVDKTAGEKRREILETSHSQTTKENYTDHGLPAKILYGFTHIRQSFGSLASEGGVLREIAFAFGLDRYDSHGELRNNPSIQGITQATIRNEDGNGNEIEINAKINNCYGGSPTIGDRKETTLAPEFHAICQAAENKRFAQVKDKELGGIYHAIPDFIYYNNLQNIENKHGEGERSFSIMEANSLYPLSFTGMTLAKDSDFYFSKGEYANAKWEGAENFGSQVLEIFQNEKCYQYGNRTIGESGNGIFLPGGSKVWVGEDKDQPSGLIKDIVYRANVRFGEISEKMEQPISKEDTAKLRGAYQEYVYSMIQAHTEMKLAKDIALVTGNKNPVIMAIRACKENIDRGGAENAKYLHTRLDPSVDQKTQDALVVGALESRALSARDRTILDHRLPQVLSFIELVSPDAFEKDMMTLYQNEGENKITFAAKTKPKFTPVL